MGANSLELWLVAAAICVRVCVVTTVDGKYACQGSSDAGAALQSDVNVTVRHTKGVGYAFLISPAVPLSPFVESLRGVVILPEDQVAPEAYAPLARALALSGCYAAIVDKATPGRTVRAMMQKPEIEFWTLAGHGNGGGALAAQLTLTLQPKVKALILVAAAMPEDVDMVDLNVIVVALYGRQDTVVTPAAVEASFARMPGDADVTSFPRLGHYDFAYSECVGNAQRPGPKALTDADFATIVLKISNPIALTQWAVAGAKALSFSDNERLTPGKNISKPYPGDIRVHCTQVPIPNTSPQRWWWAFSPTTQEIKGGLVYYPGAAVDARAYFPLAFEIAARGHLVVIVQMPLRTATLHFEEANAVIASPTFDRVPNGKWAVGGHSLGGFAASAYVAAFGERIYAAVMHAGLWDANLTENPLPVANIYGTLDSLSPGGYDRYRYLNTDPPPKGLGPLVNLKTAKFVAIEGANHYQVGDYGYQWPDEIAVISEEQQWTEFAHATVTFLDDVAAAST